MPPEYDRLISSLALLQKELSAFRPWCKGGTLGVARQKSLEQMDNFVKSKVNIAHPMNKYLMGINSQMHREMALLNMTDENSDKKIEMNSAVAQKLSAEATKEFQASLKILNDMYKKYMPEKDIKKMPATKSFNVAQQKAQQLMQQLVMAQQMMKQRAA